MDRPVDNNSVFCIPELGIFRVSAQVQFSNGVKRDLSYEVEAADEAEAFEKFKMNLDMEVVDLKQQKIGIEE